MAKYVPPSRRPGHIPSGSSLPPGARERTDVYKTQDLSTHFTHPQDSTFTFFSYPLPSPRPTLPYDPTRSAEDTPLPPSPVILPRHPLDNIISSIVLFPNAHPDWNTARELWTHTKADRLRADYWKDGIVENQEGQEGPRRNFGRPIPVFQVGNRVRGDISFAGWFQLDKMRVVAPGSEELVDLLQRKESAKGYARSGRTKEAWATALNDTWIKLRLSPSPPTSTTYDALQNPMKVKGGRDVERYLLSIGGLQEELDILESD